MIDDDIGDLVARPPDRSLHMLEECIWARIEVHTRTKQISKLIISIQSGVVAIVLISAFVFSNISDPIAGDNPQKFDIFSPEAALAPSTLLLGHRS